MPLFGTTLTLTTGGTRYNLLAVLQSGTIAGHLPAGMKNLHAASVRELTFTWVAGTVDVGDSQVSTTDSGKTLTTTDRVLQLRSGSINCISLADIWLVGTADAAKVQIFALPL